MKVGDNEGKNKRKMMERATDEYSTCSMGTKVFHDLYDDYFHLSVTTVLKHKNHAYIPLQAIPRNKQDLNKNEQTMLNILSNLCASNTMMSQIFEKIKEPILENLSQKLYIIHVNC